jgi:uncharacterized membrane protein YeaQ/YmgE (transglycosylase-associated protein family)
MVNLVLFLLSLLSGAVGGNLAGNAMKKFDLGMAGNTVAGLIGGAIGGPLTNMMMAHPDTILGVFTNIVGSGVGGAIIMVIVGLIKNAFTNRHAH